MAIEPITLIKVGTSLLSGIIGGMGSRKESKRARQIADYNARVAMMQSKAQQESIKFQSRRLVKQQRELKARQRMSIASRGGLERGTDLLSLIESAKNMQLDLLELERQQDIEQIAGETQAQQIRIGAAAAQSKGGPSILSGVLGAAESLVPSLVGNTPLFGGIRSSGQNLGSMGATQNLQMTSKYGSTIGSLIPNPYTRYTKGFSLGG